MEYIFWGISVCLLQNMPKNNGKSYQQKFSTRGEYEGVNDILLEATFTLSPWQGITYLVPSRSSLAVFVIVALAFLPQPLHKNYL